MKQASLLGLVGMGVLACGGGDAGEPELSTRAASAAECPAGGTVMQLDGEDKATICNGVDGAEGAPGAPGAVGARGERGETGAPGATGSTGASGVSGAEDVVETISCISAKRASLVGIQCTDGVTIGFGSGTVTQLGQVYTAAHVVADIATMTCSIFDIDVDHATLLGTVTDAVPDGVFDAAALNVSWVGAPPAGISPVSASPGLGDMVVATGHPQALRALHYSTGYVTAVGVTEMGTDWAGAFMADYASNGGGSGGAIFNQGCEWIGIHVGGFSDGFESSIALPFVF